MLRNMLKKLFRIWFGNVNVKVCIGRLIFLMKIGKFGGIIIIIFDLVVLKF